MLSFFDTLQNCELEINYHCKNNDRQTDMNSTKCSQLDAAQSGTETF